MVARETKFVKVRIGSVGKSCFLDLFEIGYSIYFSSNLEQLSSDATHKKPMLVIYKDLSDTTKLRCVNGITRRSS